MGVTSILEHDHTDADAINELFRSIHTFKGSSALFEFPSLTKLVHVGEDVLDEVRSGAVAISSRLIDLQLELIDILDTWLNELEANGELPEDAHELSRSLAEKLGTCRSQGDGRGEASAEAGGSLSHDEPFEWLRELDEDLRLSISREAISASVEIYAIAYDPDEKCFFQGDDPLQTCRNVPLLQSLQIETAPRDRSELFDPYHCTMQVRMISLARRAELEELFRYVPEQVDIRRVDTEALVAPDRQDVCITEAALQDLWWVTRRKTAIKVAGRSRCLHRQPSRLASCRRASVP